MRNGAFLSLKLYIASHVGFSDDAPDRFHVLYTTLLTGFMFCTQNMKPVRSIVREANQKYGE